MACSTLGFPVHHKLLSLLKLMSIESVMPSNHFILCCPLLLLSSIFPSIRVSSSESVLPIRWPNYWSFTVLSHIFLRKKLFPGSPTVLLLLSCSVVSDCLQPHGLQHTRLPCLSLSPRVCSNSCPLNRWCHPTTSFSVISFSFRLQSFPASGSLPMSWFLESGGQSIGVSASASVLPMNIQGWFPLELTGLISLHSKGLSRVFSNTTVQKHQFFGSQLSLLSNSHIHTWLLEKP